MFEEKLQKKISKKPVCNGFSTIFLCWNGTEGVKVLRFGFELNTVMAKAKLHLFSSDFTRKLKENLQMTVANYLVVIFQFFGGFIGTKGQCINGELTDDISGSKCSLHFSVI